MKKAVSTLLVVSMLTLSMNAFADQISPAIIAPLQKGQPAPWTGVLISPQAVGQIVSQVDELKAQQDLAVQHQADVDAAQQKFQIDQLTTTCTGDKSVLQAQLTDANSQNKILTDQLSKTTGGPGAGLWIGLGAAGGIVVTLLTVFAVSKVTKQ